MSSTDLNPVLLRHQGASEGSWCRLHWVSTSRGGPSRSLALRWSRGQVDRARLILYII